MREALMDGLADVAEQLGHAIVNTHRQSGGVAEDTRGRMYAIVAATIQLVDPVAKAGTTDEHKQGAIDVFIARVPKAYISQIMIQ